MKQKAIICDIDNTISNSDHRQHLIEGKRKDWKKFFEAADIDPPHMEIVNLIKLYFKEGYSIVFCSGRPEDYKKLTENWLNHHLPEVSYSLFMRAKGDFRPDNLIKKLLYKNYIEPNFDVEFVVDDRKIVVEMWRNELKLVVFQVRPGDF